MVTSMVLILLSLVIFVSRLLSKVKMTETINPDIERELLMFDNFACYYFERLKQEPDLEDVEIITEYTNLLSHCMSIEEEQLHDEFLKHAEKVMIKE